ncbi:hypothetical protein [Nocardia panacis]|nr:hypothetical protein [Nocardia panacis]
MADQFDLIAEAKSGALSVRMSPEEFARIDHECRRFVKETIREVQNDMREISKIDKWGFGDHPDSKLTSAPTMARRFREKAMGQPDGNDFYTILEEHKSAVESIRQLFGAMRDRYIAQDSTLAARFKAESERLGNPIK